MCLHLCLVFGKWWEGDSCFYLQCLYSGGEAQPGLVFWWGDGNRG
jgi:hypothetical protein